MKNEVKNSANSSDNLVALRSENEKLKAEIQDLKHTIEQLMEQIRLARHKRFGASSEKNTEAEQLSIFNEAEIYADLEETEEKLTTIAEHTRRKKKEYTLDNLPEGIPVEIVEHRIPESQRTCPQCGETMTEIGKEITRKLKIIPARVIVVEDRYFNYACRRCEQKDTQTPIVKTPKEKGVIPGSFATAETIAHLMVQKYVMGSPLYRQEKELNRQGIPITRQTMSNWMLTASKLYLTPVWERLHTELVSREVLHADETTLQVLHEEGKKAQSKSYLWLYRTSGDTDKPITLCEYQPSRSRENASPAIFSKMRKERYCLKAK